MRFARSSLIKQAAGLRMASSIVDDLSSSIRKLHEETAPKIKELRAKHGHEKLSDATLDAAYGGMRGITGLVYEPSLLDSMEGIRFRGLSIPECQKALPKAEGGDEPLPESMFWLLLTGSVPTKEQAVAFNKELVQRLKASAVDDLRKVLQAMPSGSHPMTQFSAGVLALQHNSTFANAYAEGKANKSNYWEYALQDSLDIVSHTPILAALIYNNLVSGKFDLKAQPDASLDWAANYASMIGFTDKSFWDCMRLYLSIHVDHEGGNVSAHTTTLVASALSDPYLSLSAGLNGLAGPLHGLANQEVLNFIFEMRTSLKEAGVNLRDEKELAAGIEKFTWNLLDSGRVVPGYGHAVLRQTDPRYTCQREFCLRHFPDDELFFIVNTMYSIMPGILTKQGKTKNPYPNVDAHSGVLLQHYGLTQQNYYTVLFGLSRQLGVLSGVVWDRIQGRPIERPKSTTTEALLKQFKL